MKAVKPILSESITKGIKCAVQGKFDSAQSEFEAILQKDSFDTGATLRLKIIWDLTNRKISRKSAIHLFRGIDCCLKDDWQKAIAEINKALETDPNYSESYRLRGRTFVDMQKYQNAIADYNKAIENDPKNSYAYENRGNAYLCISSYDRALSDFARAIEIDPARPSLYINRGNVHYLERRYDQAIEDFNRAIEINPNDAYAYNSRGSVFRDLGLFYEAIRDFDDAISMWVDNRWFYFNKAMVCEHIWQKDEAIDAFKKFLTKSSSQDFQEIEDAKQHIAEMEALEIRINSIVAKKVKQPNEPERDLDDSNYTVRRVHRSSPQASLENVHGSIQKPWEFSANYTATEIYPLFDDDYDYSLSELDIDPSSYNVYVLGKLIAGLHTHGCVGGDFHPGNIIQSSYHGGLVLIDPGYTTDDALIHPETMVSQFVLLFASYSLVGFLAILAGYVRNSYQILDTIHPRFTDQLLALIGGKVIASPASPIVYCDVKQLIEELGISIGKNNGALILVQTKGQSSRSIWDEESHNVFMLYVAFALLGFDCSQHFRLESESKLKSEFGLRVFEFLFKFYEQESIIAPFQFGEHFQVDIGSRFLVCCRTRLAFNKSTHELPIFENIKILEQVLKDFPIDARIRFTDMLVEVIDTLAAILDRNWNSTSDYTFLKASVEFAKLSQILLQKSTSTSRTDECRYLQMQTRHRYLSWHKGPVLDDHVFPEFLIKFEYLASAINSELRLFSNSIEDLSKEKEKAILWSYSQNSLSQLRKLLKYLQDQLELQLWSKIEYGPEFQQITKQVTKFYLLCLRLMRRASFVSIEKQCPYYCAILWVNDRVDNQEYKLKKELRWAESFISFLSKKKISTIRGRYLFKAGITIIEDEGCGSTDTLVQTFAKIKFSLSLVTWLLRNFLTFFRQ